MTEITSPPPEGKFLVTVRVERSDGQFVTSSRLLPDDLLGPGGADEGVTQDWAVREIGSAFVSAYKRAAELAYPTWDEAVAVFEAATHADLVRPPRIVIVELERDGDCWVATSPQITDYRVYADSKDEAERVTRQDLGHFLGPHVTLEFREAGLTP